MSGCGAAISERPCPRVTEFPAELQQQAAWDLGTALVLARMMDGMAADRAFNRAICWWVSARIVTAMRARDCYFSVGYEAPACMLRCRSII